MILLGSGAFRAHAPAAIGAALLILCGCGDGAGGGSGGSGPSDGAGNTSSGSTSPGSCDAGPLHTGLVAQQTGVSVDAFDCQILEQAAHDNEPDAMIFKAIIYVESRFDQDAIACPNLPCGTPSGWTAAEAGCFGLMQVVPACGGTPNNAGLRPDGHPNMATDMSSGDWPGSIFNPANNIAIGVAGIADNRAQVKKQFSGCTEDQYTLMAIGDYNSYGSTKSCTEYNNAYDDVVLMAYKEYSLAAGYPAHDY